MSEAVRFDRARVDALLDALERMAGGDVSARAPLSDARDELDAIAHAVNVMAGELLWRVREVEQAQAQVVQSAKLASLGQVSAGIAHELNNPLAVLRGYAEVTGDLVRSARRGEAWDAALAEHYLERIDAHVERMGTIIGHVREFSRQNTFTRDRVRVNDVVRRSCTLLAEQLRLARIQLDLRLDPTDPVVLGEAGRLEQVVVNLLANARDAIQEARGTTGGVVRVCTRALPDGEVEASVLDDGVGMPPEVLAEMFTPFFTTKGPGKGTGLGLSISHGIVDEHGGRLFAESQPGRGTRVVLRLPGAP